MQNLSSGPFAHFQKLPDSKLKTNSQIEIPTDFPKQFPDFPHHSKPKATPGVSFSPLRCGGCRGCRGFSISMAMGNRAMEAVEKNHMFFSGGSCGFEGKHFFLFLLLSQERNVWMKWMGVSWGHCSISWGALAHIYIYIQKHEASCF